MKKRALFPFMLAAICLIVGIVLALYYFLDQNTVFAIGAIILFILAIVSFMAAQKHRRSLLT